MSSHPPGYSPHHFKGGSARDYRIDVGKDGVAFTRHLPTNCTALSTVPQVSPSSIKSPGSPVLPAISSAVAAFGSLIAAFQSTKARQEIAQVSTLVASEGAAIRVHVTDEVTKIASKLDEQEQIRLAAHYERLRDTYEQFAEAQGDAELAKALRELATDYCAEARTRISQLPEGAEGRLPFYLTYTIAQCSLAQALAAMDQRDMALKRLENFRTVLRDEARLWIAVRSYADRLRCASDLAMYAVLFDWLDREIAALGSNKYRALSDSPQSIDAGPTAICDERWLLLGRMLPEEVDLSQAVDGPIAIDNLDRAELALSLSLRPSVRDVKEYMGLGDQTVDQKGLDRLVELSIDPMHGLSEPAAFFELEVNDVTYAQPALTAEPRQELVALDWRGLIERELERSRELDPAEAVAQLKSRRKTLERISTEYREGPSGSALKTSLFLLDVHAWSQLEVTDDASFANGVGQLLKLIQDAECVEDNAIIEAHEIRKRMFNRRIKDCDSGELDLTCKEWGADPDFPKGVALSSLVDGARNTESRRWLVSRNGAERSRALMRRACQVFTASGHGNSTLGELESALLAVTELASSRTDGDPELACSVAMQLIEAARGVEGPDAERLRVERAATDIVVQHHISAHRD